MDSRLRWQEPEWLAEVEGWIDARLREHGIGVSRPLVQPHLRPWSTVLRVPSDGGDLYFKAVAPEFHHEPALSLYLARRFPGIMPRILASDPARGWLLMEGGGQRLREILQANGSVRHWEEVLPAYAAMQIELAAQTDTLLDLGVPDRRLATLPARFEEMLADETLLGLGRGHGLDATTHRHLWEFRATFADLCQQLAAAPIPESLDHGDFHDGNIFVQRGGYRFLDWGDCSVTHPFFSLRTVFVSLENTFGVEEDSHLHGQVQEPYLAGWLSYASQAELQAVGALARRLAPFIAALRWRRALVTLEPEQRAEYAHAVPSLLRELLAENRLL